MQDVTLNFVLLRSVRYDMTIDSVLRIPVYFTVAVTFAPDFFDIRMIRNTSP